MNRTIVLAVAIAAVMLLFAAVPLIATHQAQARQHLYLKHGDSWYYKGSAKDAPDVTCGGFGNVEEGGTC